MLFIRYLQEHLHKDVDVANSLFRIVEAGFRSVLDRMSSYDCWKVPMPVLFLFSIIFILVHFRS